MHAQKWRVLKAIELKGLQVKAGLLDECDGQRLGLGGEVENIVRVRVVERLLPRSVSSCEDLMLQMVDENHRPQTVHVVEHVSAPSAPCSGQDLHIG